MAKNYVSDGTTISHTPGSALTSGEIVDLTDRVGVAIDDIASGAEGGLFVRGEFVLPKATGVSWSEGAAVNLAAGEITSGAGTAAGMATAAAASGDTTCRVSINR